MTRGKFITFEGADSSGKSTQAQLLHDYLVQHGHTVITTREPGGCAIGEDIRELAMHEKQADGLTEMLLMFAARREHILQKIKPALAAGTWVICDRFTDSTYAYQGGGRGIDEAIISQCADWVQEGLQPDLTIYLTSPPAASSEPLWAQDKFEQESSTFYSRIAEVYKKRAAQYPQRIFTVSNMEKKNGNETTRRAREEIHADIRALICTHLLSPA